MSCVLELGFIATHSESSRSRCPPSPLLRALDDTRLLMWLLLSL
eukprot:COSAG03_NODE_20885_length_312_cov_0.727700_2_plen_43_part_01